MSFANNTSHMLFILLPIAWLTVVVLFLAICRSAARGDRDASRAQLEPKTTLDPSIAGLVLWEDPLYVALHDRRTHKARSRRPLAGHRLPHHGVR